MRGYVAPISVSIASNGSCADGDPTGSCGVTTVVSSCIRPPWVFAFSSVSPRTVRLAFESEVNGLCRSRSTAGSVHLDVDREGGPDPAPRGGARRPAPRGPRGEQASPPVGMSFFFDLRRVPRGGHSLPDPPPRAERGLRGRG